MGEIVANRWAIIEVDGTFGGARIYSPDPPPDDDVAEGETVELMPVGWTNDPATTLADWAGNTPEGGRGWVDRNAFAPPRPLMPVGRFKLLLTQAERIGFREAAKTDAEVADALDLLNGFTNGISLDDPVLSALLAEMVGKDLLAEERVAPILAGDTP